MNDDSRTIKAEFHCHTVCSPDSSNQLRTSDPHGTHERGLSRLAITDHNRIGCALKAREMDPELIVVGEEILTTGGELLAYYLTEEIPARLSPMETISAPEEAGRFHRRAASLMIGAGTAGRWRCCWRSCRTWTRLRCSNARCLRGGAE